MTQSTVRNKELVLNKLLTQYDDLDMWLHNYLPSENITEDEKQHLKDVMMRDQALKKTDGNRIAKLTTSFPAKLRPELLSPVLNEMRQNNPAVPGSGLVSLCGTVALPKDPLNRFPPSTPQFLRSQSLNFLIDNSTSIAANGTNETNNASTNENTDRHRSLDEPRTPLSATFHKLFDRSEPERCPFCFRKFNLFTRKTQCEQCQRNVCSSCLHEFITNGVVYLCKDCLEITRVLCKTGDWFAQYLVLKPANPLRLEMNLNPTETQRRGSRIPEEVITWTDSIPLLCQPPPASRSRMAAVVEEQQRQKQSARKRTSGTTNAQHRERVTWTHTERSEHDGAIRSSGMEQVKSAPPEKSQPSPLTEMTTGKEHSNEKARLVRQVTVQDSAETLSGTNEQTTENEKGQKLHREKKRAFSVSLTRNNPRDRKSKLNSFSSVNEAEASYQTQMEIKGDLEVSLDYDKDSSRLAVMVWGARNIAAVDKKTGTSHPYAKVCLFPDPSKKTHRKIHCKGHTCSPTFNQGVCYTISPSDILEKTLVIELWHKRKARGSKVFLGEISVVLRNHRWDEKGRMRITLDSKLRLEHSPMPMITESSYRGELKIGLNFSMSENHQFLSQLKEGGTNFPGILQVAVREAKNLISSAAGLNVSAFVRAEILLDRYPNEPQQTDICPRTSHPIWNSMFQFPDLTQNDLYTAVLQLSVWHRTALTKTPQMLGGVRLSYKGSANLNRRSSVWNGPGSAEEARLWIDMTNKPGTWVDGIIPVRDISY